MLHFKSIVLSGKQQIILRNPTTFLIANTKYIARYWKFKIPQDNLGVSESPSHAVADPEEGEFEGDVRPFWERERERAREREREGSRTRIYYVVSVIEIH